MNICTITIQGIVNRVEMKTVGGHSLCKVGVKVQNGPKDKRVTMFFNVDIWDKSGEAAGKILVVDGPVVVAGKLSVREYEGKNGKGYSLDVRADDWSRPRDFTEGRKQRPYAEPVLTRLSDVVAVPSKPIATASDEDEPPRACGSSPAPGGARSRRG